MRGEEYPSETLLLTRNTNEIAAASYFRFLQASGTWCKKQSNMLRRNKWERGNNCTPFMFDNVASRCPDSSALKPKQAGDLKLFLQFGAGP